MSTIKVTTSEAIEVRRTEKVIIDLCCTDLAEAIRVIAQAKLNYCPTCGQKITYDLITNPPEGYEKVAGSMQ